MNIIEHLKQEHEEVRKALQKAEKSGSEKDFEQVKMLLTAHTKAEEKVFYPPLKDEKKTHELILEGIEEHHAVELYLKDMDKAKGKGDGNGEVWKAKIKVLTEMVEHHVKEEEEGVFPEAEKILSGQLEELDEKFEKEEQKHKK